MINTVPSPNPLRQDLVSETGVSTSDARTPGPTGAADSALLREERIDYGEADSAAVEQEEEEQHDDDEGVHFLHLFFLNHFFFCFMKNFVKKKYCIRLYKLIFFIL